MPPQPSCSTWKKKGKKKKKTKTKEQHPDGFVALEDDAETGKTVGWEAVEQSSFYTYWLTRAYGGHTRSPEQELIGPKVNGNPDGAQMHIVVMHDRAENLDELHADDVPRDFDGLAAWLHAHPYRASSGITPTGARPRSSGRTSRSRRVMGMDELIAFVQARLDEDEAAATALRVGDWTGVWEIGRDRERGDSAWGSACLTA